MKKVNLKEVLKRNFHIKKVNNLALAGREEVAVLVQDSKGKWKNSGISATIPDGQKVHRFRVVGDKLEFSFLGDSIEFLHSCICKKTYMCDNGNIILPQGYGEGYVVLTF